MKSLGSYLITIFLIFYWFARVLGTLFAQMEMDFPIKPLNIGVEIALLFVVLICIPFVFKRKLIGPIVILGVYGWYLGSDIFANFNAIMAGGVSDINMYTGLILEAIALVLPLFSIFDILLDKNRTKNPIDKKTDWFYKNEQYDRKLDDRADKNNYRTGL